MYFGKCITQSWDKRPGGQSAFQYILKVFRVLCRPLEFFHFNLADFHVYRYISLCTEALSCFGLLVLVKENTAV